MTANGGERKRASGVTWVGPFEGESVIELGMWNAGVRRYSLTVARSADSAPAPATAELRRDGAWALWGRRPRGSRSPRIS